MRRWIVPLLVVIALAASIGSTSADTATLAGGITVTSIKVTYAFARSMTFSVAVADSSAITAATLFYQSGVTPPRSQPADPFTPANPVDLTASVDLSKSSLSAFSTVTYWWEISDEAGRQLRTDTQTLAYIDNRFAWKDFASGAVRIHWYVGDSGFSAAAAAVANEALPHIQQQLGVEPPSPIDIYIYTKLDDLRSAVELSGHSWLGGLARPEFGVVLVAIAPGDSALVQMRHDIPHELTHLMVFIATTPSYRSVPRWLDEGLATLNEGEPDSSQAESLRAAYANNQLTPITTLCGAFPADATAAKLAYAQSRGVVQQIIDDYGSAGLQALMAAYRDGASCTGGVERGLNTTLASIELKWRSSLGPGGGAAAVASGSGPWIVIWLALALPLLGLIMWRKPKRSNL